MPGPQLPFGAPYNRYKQLLASVPTGPYYSSTGQVVPHRNQPYTLRISTSSINTNLEVFNNNISQGFITTDSQGFALLSINLVLGDNYIQLLDAAGIQVALAQMTTRDSATLMVAWTEVLENLDITIEQVLTDARIATSSASLIETVFGQTVGTANNFGYDLESYRILLEELRTAYRYWGGTTEGINRAVRAFTQTNPLIYPRSFGPEWVLGKDVIRPATNTAARPYYLNSVPSNSAVTITAIDPTNGVGTGLLKYYATSPPKLSWAAPNGADGAQVPITAAGNYTLYSANYFDTIISQPGPFTIVSSQNTILQLSIDNKTPINIVLSTGSVSAATIASTINSALNASPAYGASYNSVASASANGCLELTTPNATTNGNVIIYPLEAGQTIFNTPDIRGGLNTTYSPGTTSIVLESSTDMNLWPDIISPNGLKVIVGGMQYHPVGGSSGFATTSAAELVTVTAINKSTKTLTLKAPGTTITHNGHGIVYVQYTAPYLKSNVTNSRSITVNVSDPTLILFTTSDLISIAGSNAPNDWIVTTDSGGVPSSTPPFNTRTFFNTSFDLPFDILNACEVTIPIPNEVLNYLGFPYIIEIWGCPADPTVSGTLSTISSVNVSFNNQSSFTSFSPTVRGTIINAEVKPQEFVVSSIIPTTATDMWVQIQTSPSGATGNFTIHRVKLMVLGHGGLYLGSGTIPKNETKAKSGSLLYAWCPDALQTTETDSIGITHVDSSRPGHIDTIGPDFTWWDKYLVSDPGVNMFGVFTDSDFAAGTETNLDLVIRSPARFSYLEPALPSTVTQTLSWSSTGPFLATLNVDSDQDVTKAFILENGVPVTQDQWMFTATNQVQLLYTPVSGTYTIQYNALLQFVSSSIDLGSSNYANWLWLADYNIFIRPEIIPESIATTEGMQFNGQFTATLSQISDQNQSTSELIENTGLGTNVIPPSLWSYADAQTVNISSTVFNPASVYSFSYNAEVNIPSTAATAKVELRSATTLGGLSSATYNTININQPIGNTYEFHQFRVTLENVRDVRDVRISSVCLKGLGVINGSETTPILNP